ncbi:MAG TPA: FAD-dependent oxidoreductase [Streptosporangiaceae bacterium]|jgi:glycine/D-amino acid oxidase-like deaminating enzyme
MSIQAVDAQRAYDTIIVGNGSIGLSLGLVLARRGLAVAVVGKSSRPFAASAAAGAMNGCFGEATPGLLRSEHGRAKLAMDVRATGMWDAWEQSLVEESDETAIRTANGTVVILNTIGIPEIDSAGYASIRAALEEYKEPYEDLDPADIPWLNPEPGSRPLRAMFIPGERAVNTIALLRGLGTAFTRAKGTLVDEHASGLQISGGKVTGVTFASGQTLSAPTVVLAAGAASYDLLAGLPEESRDLIPAMVCGYGIALLIGTTDGTVPDSVIRTPNRAFACGLHVVPRGEGRIYLGATNNISPQPRDSGKVGDLNLLLGCTRQLRTDLVEAAVERIMVGNRPVPLDGFPLIGELSAVGVSGLWMMTGTYRDGLHQSPLLAHEMGARILGEPHDKELDVFTPVRPPIQAMSREECLKTAVQHTLALGFEQDWDLPMEWPPIIEEQLERWYTELMDQFDSQFTPPPELLAYGEDDINDQLKKYYAAYKDSV